MIHILMERSTLVGLCGGAVLMGRGEPNLQHLTPLSEERQRLMDAVEEAQWQGNFDQSDLIELELEMINTCITKGELYVPLF
tara:strand:- start:1499 stop:1744 length:246 start_codon:yes stop_codon:yes gene_type:complete